MKTEMGKGIDFMEGTHEWHGIAPNDEQLAAIQILIDLSVEQENEAIVRQMKKIVPEFISNNSEYQKLDK